MGRPHKNVAVIIAFDESGQKIDEKIVPRANYEMSGSLFLNSAPVRQAMGIRCVTIRIFDEQGMRVENHSQWFGRDGHPGDVPHRMPDGTVIE